jgi:hypothetical protein
VSSLILVSIEGKLKLVSKFSMPLPLLVRFPKRVADKYAYENSTRDICAVHLLLYLHRLRSDQKSRAR